MWPLIIDNYLDQLFTSIELTLLEDSYWLLMNVCSYYHKKNRYCNAMLASCSWKALH